MKAAWLIGGAVAGLVGARLLRSRFVLDAQTGELRAGGENASGGAIVGGTYEQGRTITPDGVLVSGPAPTVLITPESRALPSYDNIQSGRRGDKYVVHDWWGTPWVFDPEFNQLARDAAKDTSPGYQINWVAAAMRLFFRVHEHDEPTMYLRRRDQTIRVPMALAAPVGQVAPALVNADFYEPGRAQARRLFNAGAIAVWHIPQTTDGDRRNLVNIERDYLPHETWISALAFRLPTAAEAGIL